MENRSPWLVIVGGGLLLALSLWSMHTILGPVIATAGLFFLLWPSREQTAVRRLLIVVALLLILWILTQARAIVYPALAALAIAFLLDPAVDRLTRRGVRRSISTLAVMLPVFAALLVFLLVVIPALFEQARTLIQQLPTAYEKVVVWLEPLLAELLRSEEPLLLPHDISELLPTAEPVLKGLLSGLIQVGRGVAAIFQVSSFLLLTPILTYYILVDFGRLRDTVRPYLPQSWLEKLGPLADIFQESVGAWLKGQLLVALIMAGLTMGGFLLIRLPYALLLGFLAGLLNLLPVLGFWITFIVSLVVALFAHPPLPMLLKTAGLLLALQAVEQHLLSPRIVGRQLGVKPVILLLVMLGMFVFLGVLGLLLAAPVIGLTRGLWTLWGPEPRRSAD